MRVRECEIIVHIEDERDWESYVHLEWLAYLPFRPRAKSTPIMFGKREAPWSWATTVVFGSVTFCYSQNRYICHANVECRRAVMNDFLEAFVAAGFKMTKDKRTAQPPKPKPTQRQRQKKGRA